MTHRTDDAMINHVCVNARFRHQRMTGVQRYAQAVLARLPGGVQSIAPQSPALAGGVRGHLWEQTRLPMRVLGRVLWSPCNTGPLGAGRHVVTIHDTAFLDCPECFSPRFRTWYQWLIPRLVRSARRILTVSQFSAARLIERCGADESAVCVIPNGVDPQFQPACETERSRVRSKYDLPEEFVLTLGSLDPRKNLARVCQAWQTNHRIQEVPLVLAGGTARVFAQTPGLSLPRCVRLLGYVADEDLPALYSAASVFVYASTYEGFGLPPLEAMACGTPTVVSNATSLPEVVGKAAVLVDPHCGESIAAGVCSALEETTLRAALSEQGRDRARQFRWETTAQRVWDELCAVASC